MRARGTRAARWRRERTPALHAACALLAAAAVGLVVAARALPAHAGPGVGVRRMAAAPAGSAPGAPGRLPGARTPDDGLRVVPRDRPGAPDRPGGSEPPRPDIVVVLTDDLNERLFDAVPALRGFAREGMRFRAVAPSPLCAPSRASLLTGLHNHNHRILTNARANRLAWAARHAGNALPDWLQASGYRTIFAGKLMNGCERCVRRGWDLVLRHRKEDSSTSTRWYWLDDLANDAAAAIGGTPSGQPLFLYFSPPTPHAPFVPSPRYLGTLDAQLADIRFRLSWVPSFNEVDVSDKRTLRVLGSPPMSAATIDRVAANRARRQEMMLSVRDAIWTLQAALRRAGRDRNTYLFFTSDNGFFEGEHRRPSGKGLPYEEALVVPLFVTGPDVPPASSSDALVYNHDVTATIVDLARADAPPLDGRSLAPLWRGAAPQWRRRVLLEHYDRRRALAFAGVREAGRKTFSFPDGSGETYDLERDPYELESSDATSDFRATSRPLLERLLSCAGEACWEAETAPDDASGEP